MAWRIKNLSAVILMAAAFFWSAPCIGAYGAGAGTTDYNYARLRVARIAPGLEALAGEKPPIVITPEIKKDACVLPNGNILITAGLIESCKSDDELAFVIAHELSHVLAKDFENSGTSLTGSDGVPESELREIRADMRAAHFVKKAGYDPYASIRILGRLTNGAGLKLRLERLSSYLNAMPGR